MLSFIFFIKRPGHVASRILGAYICIFSLGMLENYLNARLTGPLGQLVYSFMGFSNFTYGPLLYLFVNFLTVKEPVFTRRHLIHFLPFGFLFVLDSLLILTAHQGIRQDRGLLEMALFETLVFQILTYNVLAILKLRKYGKAILHIHGNLKRKDLNWLLSLVVFLTGIYVLSFGITHAIAFGLTAAGQYYVLVQVLITVLIYVMSYRMLLQPQLFILQPHPEKEAPIPVPALANGQAAEKYQRSGLKPAQAEQYLQSLLAFMETEKPYRDPDLTLQTLAEKLAVSRNHLTEIINGKLEKNFFEFVNTYRIEEVKQLLADSRLSHLNLYALGFKAGFKSKTAFNNNFKKITGFTPSAWKHHDKHVNERIRKQVLT